MTYRNRVTHRPIGVIPGCASAGPVTCPAFDDRAYWASVDRYCAAIRDYVAASQARRAEAIMPELLAA